jgi:hypothetical protein
MRTKWLPALILAILLPGALACSYYHHPYGYPVHYPYGQPADHPYSQPAGPLYGHHFYPDAPRLAATDPARVALLKAAPSRDHIRLGEVWIRPTQEMDRFYVEGVLREKAAGMGADALVIVADASRAGFDGRIVGIAVSYKR